MKGHFYRRGCTCETKNCTCGSKWSFIVDIGRDPETGKRRQKGKGGFNTKEEAEAAAAALITKVNQGTYVRETNILFKDMPNKWLPIYIDKVAPKPSTLRLRLYGINKLLKYFAHIKLKNITEDMYQAALNDLKQEGLTRSTIEGIHTTAKMIFKLAVDKRMITANPTENAYIKKDKQIIIESDKDELPNHFEKDELALFLKVATQHGLFMDELIFITLSYTGIRVGELVALKWKDINFDKNIISITKTYYNPRNNTKEYELLPPKTSKSRRKIMVDDVVIDAFKKHKEKQSKIIAWMGDSYHDDGFIFANVNRYPGYPILIKLVEMRMKRLLNKAGLNTSLTPHSLRHTHTSLLAEAGVEFEEIMDRLGHIDDDVTRKIYLHITEEMKKEASEKFSKLMRGL